MNAKSAFLALLLCTSAIAQSTSPPLPPLIEPATGEKFPGKFIWTDRFASEFEQARDLYSALFGWEWRIISEEPIPYGMFYNDGEAVTGLMEWEPDGVARPYGRWIHYISVDDVPATVKAVLAHGGRAMSGYRDVPERGQYAILAGPGEAPFGVLDSSSGDPDEYRARVGDWIWIDLFTDDAVYAIDFYESIFGYSTYENPDENSPNDIVISSGGYSRGGISELSKDSENSPQWFGYIRVDSVSEITARVAELGGTVMYEPDFDVHDMSMAIIEGPSGSLFGLLEWTYYDDETGEATPPEADTSGEGSP
jgi:predicted enzyme related to lactoylglutathione lyase